MNTAFVLFDGLTVLDLVGVYDPLVRLKTAQLLPDFTWDVCALDEEVVDDNHGLRLRADTIGKPLSGYDLIVVPGGRGTRQLRHDGAFVEWIRSGESVPLKASVCTGSLLLGAAGFLKGKRAATHPSARRHLAAYCDEVVEERVVDEGDVVTAGGVSAGIDLGLHLVERLAGREARDTVAAKMDYPYDTRSLPRA